MSDEERFAYVVIAGQGSCPSDFYEWPVRVFENEEEAQAFADAGPDADSSADDYEVREVPFVARPRDELEAEFAKLMARWEKLKQDAADYDMARKMKAIVADHAKGLRRR